MSDDDIFSKLFSDWATAVIFLICVLGVLFAIAKLKRVNALAKFCFALMFLIIFKEFITPLLLDVLCGDKTVLDLYLLLALRETYFGNPSLGLYFLSLSVSKPLVDFKNFFDLIFYILSMFIGAIIITKSAKSFQKRDPAPDPKERDEK